MKWLLFLASFGACVGAVPRARACDCGPPSTISDSLPKDGDVDVPTDVVPWVRGPWNVVLVNAAGDVVPTQALGRYTPRCEVIYELEPQVSLEPGARYALVPEEHQTDTATFGVWFTTADGPAAGKPPAKPRVQLIPFEARALTDFCTIIAPPEQACLDADYAGLLDVLITTEDTTTHVVQFAGELDKLLLLGAPPKSLRNPPRRTCVEVRARDLAGRRSEPSVHCFDAANLPRVKELDGGVDERCDSPQLQALPSVGDGEDTTLRAAESEPSPEQYEGCTLTLTPSSRAPHSALGLGVLLAVGVGLVRRREGRV